MVMAILAAWCSTSLVVEKAVEIEKEKESLDVLGGDEFQFLVTDDEGPQKLNVNTNVVLSLLKQRRSNQKQKYENNASVKVVPPLKLRLSAPKRKNDEATPAPIDHSVSADEPPPPPPPKKPNSESRSKSKDVRRSSDGATVSSEPGVSRTKEKSGASTSKPTKPIFSTLSSAFKVPKLQSKAGTSEEKTTSSKSTGVSSATIKATSSPASVASTSKPKDEPSSEDVVKEKQKKKKHHHHRTEKESDQECDTGANESKSKEQLRQRAKELSTVIGKVLPHSLKRHHHATPVDTLRKKAKFTSSFKKSKLMSLVKKNKPAEDERDLFVRKSILDRSMEQSRPNLKQMFGFEPTPKTATETPPATSASTAQANPFWNIGRFHSFVGNRGHRNRQLRKFGALHLTKTNGLKLYNSYMDLFNNLTSKVTKAVRQNNGFKTIKEPPNWKQPSAEPRFANRKPHRSFIVPNTYEDGRKVRAEQNWNAKDVESMRERCMNELLDREMMGLKSLTEDVVVATRNAIHLYLSGLNSELGDTANLESDLRQGRLTPAKDWLKPKPYVHSIIKALKFRGQPHITYEPPASIEDHESDYGRASNADSGFGPSETPASLTAERNGSEDFPRTSGGSYGRGTTTDPTSPALTSPMASFPSASPAVDDFGRPLYNGPASGQFDFGYSGPPVFRQPLLPAPPRPPTYEYSDFSTRTW